MGKGVGLLARGVRKGQGKKPSKEGAEEIIEEGNQDG